ncbi:hypothetical protein GCM10007147_21670 [Nocardiopsis kunsanensis]|uniref:Insertion element IS150 protein InsJ-like helix-turn-helix domain-containing protein n=1 Tax=Nocardiopsis kunsanensis TaxID=141693 RepID=A0A918XBW4_9ACTN|nr:hypothetical protein GCM10007147_21670 [Nocardiopsis kunsanensis]
MAKPTKKPYSFEFKARAVRRCLAGESKTDLAQELGLSTPKLLESWVRTYRNEGEEGLRPKRRGRPPRRAEGTADAPSELEKLRRENEYLAAENAYLKKLRALREQGHQ